MNRCKKLLCLALALIMALSLCTVAMADEATELSQVDFVLGEKYAYGKTAQDAIGSASNSNLSFDKVNNALNTGAFNLLYDNCAICTKNGNLYTGLASTTVLMDHTNYYLKIVFRVYSNDPLGGYKLPADFEDLQAVGEVVTLTFNGNTCNPVKVEPFYKQTSNNDVYDQCTVYFELPQLDAKTTTVTIPFAKKVELGGNKAPGSTTFKVEQLGEYPNVNVTGTVTVTGDSEYKGQITVSGPEASVDSCIKEGFVVKEVNDGAKNWTYDDTAWYVREKDTPVLNSVDSSAATSSVTFEFIKGKIVDKEFVADSNEYSDTMFFTNIYTENTAAPTPKPSKPATTVVEAPKTFDGGVALCAALSVLSMTGAVVVGKKRDK